MATRTKRRSQMGRPVQHPKRRGATRPRGLLYGAAAAGLIALAAVIALIAFAGGGGSPKASAGLPDTPDYHSLLVSPSNPEKLVLGTHDGLYVSTDGGKAWTFEGLSGNDAMNLARPSGNTVWLAGHEVFKKSVDGGISWSDVAPSGLPGLDIHGFAVDPKRPTTLYAAVAGQGLYRSRDGGRSFALVSRQVGGAVMALALMPDGRILAGDMQQGLLVSRNGGTAWRRTLGAQVLGLAVNPRDATRVIATGGGISLSTDGGRTWRTVLDLPSGGGPVAWSPSRPSLAYVVGFDRTLYRSVDGGQTWLPVAEKG